MADDAAAATGPWRKRAEALPRFKVDVDWAEFPEAHARLGYVDPPIPG